MQSFPASRPEDQVGKCNHRGCAIAPTPTLLAIVAKAPVRLRRFALEAQGVALGNVEPG